MRLLASVTGVDEARIALAAGADVIDAKDPARGPLGALACHTVAEIVAAAGGAPVSATLGHDRDDARSLLRETQALVEAGVTYLKVGLAMRSLAEPAAHDALAQAARFHPMIVVPLVDRALHGSDADLALVDAIAALGAHGVLFDTHDKHDAAGRRRTLRHYVSDGRLAALVARSRQRGLVCGLAGGLGGDDIEPLAALAPDLLGFRSALCRGEDRRAVIAADSVRAVRERIDRCSRHDSATDRGRLANVVSGLCGDAHHADQDA